MEKIGVYAFLLGVIIAVIVGAASTFVALDKTVVQASGAALVLLGVVVGFLNIHEKETTTFLVAAIALSIGLGGVGAFTPWGEINSLSVGGFLNAILSNMALFVIPAAIVVALKAIWDSGSK